MAVLKGRGIETFLSRLDPPAAIVLLFGPDHGLVTERARALVRRALGSGADDPFQAPVLSADVFSADPGRLADELYSIPLFGGRKALRVRSAGDALTPAVAAILRAPPRDAILILEAGELKPGSTLRKLVEGASGAVAIACYHDEGAGVSRLIDEELAAVGAKATPEARALLLAMLGGDRAATRAELQKLALFVTGQTSVEEKDVLAILGDASAVAGDDLIDAAFAGRADEVATSYRRLVSAGIAPASLAGAGLRRADLLVRLAGRIEAGASIDRVLSDLKPKPHFRVRDALERGLRRWSRAALSDAAARLQDAILVTRQQPALAEAVVERTLLALAMSARK